jgi:hypothetical protein
MMHITKWFTTLGVVGATCIGMAACTTTTTDEPNTGDDGSTQPQNNDSGSTSDTGTSPETGTSSPDSGEAGSCGVAPSTGTQACDECLETMCCSQLETCFGTAPDASTTCEMLVGCVQSLEAGDADSGIAAMSMADALESCAPDGGTNYSATDVTSALGVLGCLGDGAGGTGACATACATQ